MQIKVGLRKFALIGGLISILFLASLALFGASKSNNLANPGKNEPFEAGVSSPGSPEPELSAITGPTGLPNSGNETLPTFNPRAFSCSVLIERIATQKFQVKVSANPSIATIWLHVDYWPKSRFEEISMVNGQAKFEFLHALAPDKSIVATVHSLPVSDPETTMCYDQS